MSNCLKVGYRVSGFDFRDVWNVLVGMVSDFLNCRGVVLLIM